MSAWRSYILMGGGNLAVEVASYLADIRSAAEHGGSHTDTPTVSDVVATGPTRHEDIARTIGTMPRVHETPDTVENRGEKLAVICIGEAAARRRVFGDALAAGLQLGSVIHPSALVATTATIGTGVIICPFAFVGPFATVGDNVAINVHATIGHDAVIEHSTVVSPGAQLNGFSRAGVASFVGAGAVIYPRMSLGAFSKLSAGSILNKAAGDGFVMHGNPAVGRQMMAVPDDERS